MNSVSRFFQWNEMGKAGGWNKYRLLFHTIAINGRQGNIAMEFGRITEPSVWLYDKHHAHPVDELFMGWAVGILGEACGWLEVVTHYGYRGFLKKGTLNGCTAEGLQDRDRFGQTGVVKQAFADVLAEPKVQAEILCTLNRGSFLFPLPERMGGYRRVMLADGREGYVPCKAYEERNDHDGYLYTNKPENYFLMRGEMTGQQELLFRRRLVGYAKSYLGTQYRWAGKSAAGIDCSGLTFMCYLMCGVIIYRDAGLKEGYPVHPIPLAHARPGDLLYFPGHIAMYIGDSRYIHSTGNEVSFGCVVNSLSKKDPDFREDLAKDFLSAGSIM